MRGVRGMLAFALAVVVVCSGGALSAAPAIPPVPVPPRAPAPPPPRPPVIYIYGDSVVAGGARQITARLRAEGWEPHVNAIPGVSIAQVAAAVMNAPSMPHVVVLGLGYSYFWKPPVLRQQIDALMYALSRRNVARVIWLTVRENRPERRDVNDALVAATKRWGNLEIADWNATAQGHCCIFLPDGHHLLPSGGGLMAALIAKRLNAYRHGAPIPPPPTFGPRIEARPDVLLFGSSDAATLTAATAAHTTTSRVPYVGLASTRSGHGYWIAQRDGSVVHEGDAEDLGSLTHLRLNAPIVGIASSATGKGFWLVASDGGVFSFGDARFFGSTGNIRLNQPIVGMARTRSGRGYWLVASDGGVFAFGDAAFYGSTGAIQLAQPIVAIAPLPDTRGYWLLAYDGGVFSFGHAHFFGTGATTPRYWPIVDGVSTADGKGYWLLTANGDVLRYGDAALFGSTISIVAQSLAIDRRQSGGYFVLRVGTA